MIVVEFAAEGHNDALMILCLLASLALTVAALLAVFRFKVGMIPVLAACSTAGVLLYLVTGVTA